MITKKNIWEVLENIPPMEGHIGPIMLHELSRCMSGTGEWRVILCSDFGYSEHVYGRTAFEALKNAIERLCHEASQASPSH